MASTANTTMAPTRPPSNVLPFRRPVDPLAYAPGVMPFDPSNPKHIAAWNSLLTAGARLTLYRRSPDDGEPG